MENSSKKYNPDIEINLKNKEHERKNEKYNLTTNIYNPITGIVPSQITSQNDLLLNHKTQNDLSKLILLKQNERLMQNQDFNNKQNTNINTNNNINTNINTNTNNNYIQTFEELKNNINKIKNNNLQSNNLQSSNILNQLKDLKIIK